MKCFLTKNAINIAVFSVTFYIISVFITFDTYCKNQVIPETPLLNIAGLPFLRMDFVLILFAITFLIGTLLTVLLQKAIKTILPLSLGILGCLALFISLFDVNTMQLIDPTMRISHVIMTVSRVLAIVVGASGIFSGIAVTALFSSVFSGKSIWTASVSAIIASVIATAENMQSALYFICAALLLFSSLTTDFSKAVSWTITKSKISKNTLAQFISVLSITVLFGILYSVLCENAGINELAFTAVSGLILLLLFTGLSNKQSGIINSLAMLFGSILSYILIHYTAEVITYSGNRVIYIMPYTIGIICLSIVLLSTVYKFINSCKSKKFCIENTNVV